MVDMRGNEDEHLNRQTSITEVRHLRVQNKLLLA